jgi:hypothetical protein
VPVLRVHPTRPRAAGVRACGTVLVPETIACKSTPMTTVSLPLRVDFASHHRRAVKDVAGCSAPSAVALREARQRGAPPAVLEALRDHLAALLEELRRLRGRAV